MNVESPIVIRNIFYMLAYAYQAIDLKGFVQVGAEDFDNMLDLLGAIYVQGLAEQLRRGLEQGYVEYAEDTCRPRGRIDVRTSVDVMHQQRLDLRCTFSEMSADTELNRLIKCVGLAFLRSDELREQTKIRVRRLLPYLSDVTTVSTVCARHIRPIFTRSNKSYQLLVSICQFALNSLLPDESTGERGFQRVVDDQQLSRLFEKFLLAYFRKNHADKVSADASRISWDTTEDLPPFLPELHTDVTLRGKGNKEGRTLIIDAKFYRRVLTEHYNKRLLSPDNVYQIFTYVKNADTAHDGSVNGLLLYARTNEKALAADATICSWESGRNRFQARTLDLNQPFENIKKQLDEIPALL